MKSYVRDISERGEISSCHWIDISYLFLSVTKHHAGVRRVPWLPEHQGVPVTEGSEEITPLQESMEVHAPNNLNLNLKYHGGGEFHMYDFL